MIRIIDKVGELFNGLAPKMKNQFSRVMSLQIQLLFFLKLIKIDYHFGAYFRHKYHSTGNGMDTGREHSFTQNIKLKVVK